MRIHNLYEDANGESHFRDIEVDWIEETPTGKLSKRHRQLDGPGDTCARGSG